MDVTERHFFSKELTRILKGPLRSMAAMEKEIFRIRFKQYFPDVFRPLKLLYGHREDFQKHLRNFLTIVAKGYAQRPKELRLLDLHRVAEPDWFQKSDMIGYVCYVDRFAGTLQGVVGKIPYLKSLGITYLHLMPLLNPRPRPNDGGYAVIDYREVNPELGSMTDLKNLATELHHNGISLCIDMVCNHTAREHPWVQKALAGDQKYQNYYIMFPDRTVPDQYERTLLEIFPDFSPGNFTYYPEIERWVWTTFNDYQWDLNYQNPLVFGEMLDIVLFLANQGIEILRMDAVAFMWKRLGTDCQNQPEAHYILQAFRALSRIAAPGLILKAEAIVPPDKLVPYLGQKEATNKECELAYHNSFMVQLWSSLASGDVTLMTHALQQMPEIPTGTSWITYIRCHDDIGWAISDEDAESMGLSGILHRAFLSDFYSGRFPKSFARGATFQHNPKTGDRRISGTLASLAGLELALETENWQALDLAVRRILLLHGLIFSFRGLPLIYMGDELGLLNDTSYLDHPLLADDNRWMHRPFMDWEKANEARDWTGLTGRIYKGINHLIRARKQTHAFHAQALAFAVWTHNIHVLGLIRESPRGRLLILANFSENVQTVPRYRIHDMKFKGQLHDHLDGQNYDGSSDMALEPYQTLWLESMGKNQ